MFGAEMEIVAFWLSITVRFGDAPLTVTLPTDKSIVRSEQNCLVKGSSNDVSAFADWTQD